MGKIHSVNGTLLDPEATAYPCGLVAMSVFNDTYQLYKRNPMQYPSNNNKVEVNTENIVWAKDKSSYKNLEGDDMLTKQWIDVTDCK